MKHLFVCHKFTPAPFIRGPAIDGSELPPINPNPGKNKPSPEPCFDPERGDAAAKSKKKLPDENTCAPGGNLPANYVVDNCQNSPSSSSSA